MTKIKNLSKNFKYLHCVKYVKRNLPIKINKTKIKSDCVCLVCLLRRSLHCIHTLKENKTYGSSSHGSSFPDVQQLK